MADGLTEAELISIIERKTDMAETGMSNIRRDREQSLKFYNQEPYGDEQEGRSSFVTSEVRDTIEWTLPQLIEMFIGGDNPLVFVPRNAEDTEAAKQESDYVRYVANDQNDGFLNMYEWFKDALLTKNGIMKTFWDDDNQETVEEYENQSFTELAALIGDEGLDIEKITVFEEKDKEREEIKSFKTIESFNKSFTEGKIDVRNPKITFGIKGTREEDLSQVSEYVVPPENFYVDLNQTSLNLDDSEFIREDMFLTESDLLVMGISQDVINTIPSENSTRLNNSESENRYKKEGGLFNDQSQTDKATRRLKISDVYLKADFDGDGIAERRFVKIAADDIILENEETDYQPYTVITPNILTHKFYGMSQADMVADLQRLSSVLWRQTLDSLYLSNDPRKVVINGQVNIDDLLTSRPGGIIRAESIGAVQDLNTPFVARDSLPVMDRIERMRAQRTGVSETTQGLDPDSLADSTNMVGAMIMNAAQGRIKMIARIFAEVGMKPRMMKIHELVLKHEKNEKIFDLNEEFVTVKPSTWRSRRDMKVKVGVGFSERKERIIATERVLNAQKDVFAAQGPVGPLLTPQNVYNALQDLQELTGLDNRDRYFSNPENFKAPPPPEDIASETLEIAEAEITMNAQEAAAKQRLAEKSQADDVALKKEALAIKKAEVMLKAEGDEEERELKAIFKAAELEADQITETRKTFREVAKAATVNSGGQNGAIQPNTEGS